MFLNSALLDSYSLPSDYEDSVIDLNNLIRAASVNSMPIIGVDAQSRIDYDRGLEYKLRFQGGDGMGLPVANTILEPSDGFFTFPVHGRFSPSQIDFILVHSRLLHVARCGPFYFEGTNI